MVVASLGSLTIVGLRREAAATTGITVDGNALKRDGRARLGFTMGGRLTPLGCRKGNAGARHLNQKEMHGAKIGWKANTLRFQVSHSGLTGYDAADRAKYLGIVKSGVALARMSPNGLNVVISMQDQPISCGKSRVLPPLRALNAWKTLASTSNNDHYSMFESWNEPDNYPVYNRSDLSNALDAQRPSGGTGSRGARSP